MSKSIVLVTGILAAALLSGCNSDAPDDMASSEMAKWIGKNVIIQFRRDALGAAADLPVSPTTGSINGAKTSIVGLLQTVDATGVTLGNHQRKGSPRWIPREVILFVELQP